MIADHKTPESELPILICYGADHTLSVKGDPQNPWFNYGVSINPASGETLPFQSSPAQGALQTLVETGTAWALKCAEDGEERNFDCCIHSEFTATPYRIPMRVGHFSRKFGYTQTIIPASMINETVHASIEVVSTYTGKQLENVKVQWSVDGRFSHFDNTQASGFSRFAYAFPDPGGHTIHASIKNEIDGSLVTHEFSVQIYESNPWELVSIKVNGTPQPFDKAIVLPFDRPTEIIIDDEHEITRQLLLELTDIEGTRITVEPAGWQDPLNRQFKWTLTPETGKRGRFKFALASKEIELPREFDGRVLSDNLSAEVDVEINGKRTDHDNNIFFRDLPYTIKLIPKTATGAVITDLPVTLNYTIKSGLAKGDLRSTPEFDEDNKDQQWSMTGSNKSGIFDLSIACWGVANPLVLSANMLISQNIEDEAKASLDNDDSAFFLRGDTRTLTLTPKPGSPFDKVPVALRWVSGTNITSADLTCNPQLDVYSTTKTWAITPSNLKSGTMILELIFEHSVIAYTLPTYTIMSKNHSDEVDVKLDGNPVGVGTVFTAGKLHNLTVTAKPHSPYAYMPVSLIWGSSSTLTAADFTCAPSFGAPGMQFKWGITGNTNKQGQFSLELKWVQLTGTMSLGGLVLR